eukprot:8240207-Alexandrium_andersonii.AAC.1
MRERARPTAPALDAGHEVGEALESLFPKEGKDGAAPPVRARSPLCRGAEEPAPASGVDAPAGGMRAGPHCQFIDNPSILGCVRLDPLRSRGATFLSEKTAPPTPKKIHGRGAPERLLAR